MSPLAATRSVLDSIVSHAHAPYPVHRVHRAKAPRPLIRRATLQRKDFGVMPVCSSVRPLASQRERAGLG